MKQTAIEIKRHWGRVDLPEVERLWDKLLPNFGSFTKYYKEEDLLCLYVYRGCLTYKVSSLLEKLEELFPEDYKVLSVEEIVLKHYSEDALKLLHSLDAERLFKE